MLSGYFLDTPLQRSLNVKDSGLIKPPTSYFPQTMMTRTKQTVPKRKQFVYRPITTGPVVKRAEVRVDAGIYDKDDKDEDDNYPVSDTLYQ